MTVSFLALQRTGIVADCRHGGTPPGEFCTAEWGSGARCRGGHRPEELGRC